MHELSHILFCLSARKEREKPMISPHQTESETQVTVTNACAKAVKPLPTFPLPPLPPSAHALWVPHFETTLSEDKLVRSDGVLEQVIHRRRLAEECIQTSGKYTTLHMI